MKKVVYISGPMTGMPNFNHDAFNAKAAELTEMGYIVLNPAMLPVGLRQSQYMDIGMAMVRCATHIVLLDGWERSDGAVAEYALAKKLHITLLDRDVKIMVDNQYRFEPQFA